MPLRVKVIALLTVRPGGAGELTNLLLGMAPLCRVETGSLRWDIWQDQTRSDRYVLDELYVDDVAVAAHRDTAHDKGYLRRIGDLADRTARVLGPVAVEPKARW